MRAERKPSKVGAESHAVSFLSLALIWFGFRLPTPLLGALISIAGNKVRSYSFIYRSVLSAGQGHSGAKKEKKEDCFDQ